MVMGGGGGEEGGEGGGADGVGGGGGGGARLESMDSFISAINSIALSLLQYFSCRQVSIVPWTAGRTNSMISSASEAKLK